MASGGIAPHAAHLGPNLDRAPKKIRKKSLGNAEASDVDYDQADEKEQYNAELITDFHKEFKYPLQWVTGQTLNNSTSSPEDQKKDAIYVKGNFNDLILKCDNLNRPIWVCPGGHILLETFCPHSRQATDFCTAIAEPICRPELIHEYKITIFSLYAAISIGLMPEEIIKTLNMLSKNELPKDLTKQIELHESTVEALLDKLLTSDEIRAARIQTASKLFLQAANPSDDVTTPAIKKEGVNSGSASGGTAPDITEKADSKNITDSNNTACADSKYIESDAPTLDESQLAYKVTGASKMNFMDPLEADKIIIKEEVETAAPKRAQKVYSFQIDNHKLEKVKQEALKLGMPLLEEFDFRKKSSFSKKDELNISLKPTANIRYYQERSLSKMFGNGRARSGTIVLPCGAGKTLVGVTAVATMQRSALVLTTTAVAVNQWKRQFVMWSTVDESLVKLFTADTKDPLPANGDACIVVSTYHMLGFGGKRSAMAEKMFDAIANRDWGILVCDEVQVMPAATFRRVASVVKSHCKLGLTATLVREDNLIEDLNWLIGPKLYEANWHELQDKGFLAKVKCVEVWCEMPKEFYAEYLNCSGMMMKRGLCVCNPNKLNITESLIRFHENRGDKVIVFSDDVFALEMVARSFSKPFICGRVPTCERALLLKSFQHNPNLNTIFLSKVGDNAIDLPAANVIIQISSHFGSRMQEAQRLGRILRPKPVTEDSDGGYNAFFYTLVSKDTCEVHYSNKRQQFLIDQGYSYKVVNDMISFMQGETFTFSSQKKQLSLLQALLKMDDTSMAETAGEAWGSSGRGDDSGVKTTYNNLSTISGADGSFYSSGQAPKIKTEENSKKRKKN
eukprot:GHVL01016191.1.p1 GENE.GHVL01016191.1~~GHVL01016191.1.p1  ORF type:complete len:850 (-),score=205.58 GHVL01016191.1:229-2778(-)